MGACRHRRMRLSTRGLSNGLARVQRNKAESEQAVQLHRFWSIGSYTRFCLLKSY